MMGCSGQRKGTAVIMGRSRLEDTDEDPMVEVGITYNASGGSEELACSDIERWRYSASGEVWNVHVLTV